MAAAVNLLLSGCVSLNGEEPSSTPPNQLSEQEKKEGWELLFDGKTVRGWHPFRKDEDPGAGWVVEKDCLKVIAGSKAGDIVSAGKFDDFDLRWEWRIPAKANNGIKYFIDESRKEAVGHEYQMIDDSDGPRGKHSTASFYDVLPPTGKGTAKIGEFNSSRVLVQGNHVEHWLNGEKMIEYELGSPEVMAAVAKSKFKSVPGFGTHIRGHILLTYHNDEAAFRNIKIRRLSSK